MNSYMVLFPPHADLELDGEKQSGNIRYRSIESASASALRIQPAELALDGFEQGLTSACGSLCRSYASAQLSPSSSYSPVSPSSSSLQLSFPSSTLIRRSFLSPSPSLRPSLGMPATKHQPPLIPVITPRGLPFDNTHLEFQKRHHSPSTSNTPKAPPTLLPTIGSKSVNTNTTPEKTSQSSNMESTTPVLHLSLYEVRHTTTKGFGLFAVKDIPAGTLLIEEIPLLMAPVGSRMSQVVVQSFVNLPLAAKKAWIILSSRDKARGAIDQTEVDEEVYDDEVHLAKTPSSMPNLVEDKDTGRPQIALSEESGSSKADEENNVFIGQENHNGMDGRLSVLSIGAGENFPGEQCRKTVRTVYKYQDFKTLYERKTAMRREGNCETGIEPHSSSLCGTSDPLEPHMRRDSAVAHVLPKDISSQDIATEGVPTKNIFKESTVRSRAVQQIMDTDTALNIFDTNALGCEINGKISAALCLHAARLNHSCTPNVFCAYDTESKTHTVHATKNIVAGKELCNSYIAGIYLTSEERKFELAKWGFECMCAACSGEVRGSDERRLQLCALHQKADATRKEFQKGQLSPEGAEQGAQVVMRMLELMQEEVLVGGEMADLCGAVGLLNIQAGHENLALPWLWRKIELLRCCHGNTSPIFRREMASFERLYDRLCGIAL